jgi:hypothetical protein
MPGKAVQRDFSVAYRVGGWIGLLFTYRCNSFEYIPLESIFFGDFGVPTLSSTSPQIIALPTVQNWEERWIVYHAERLSLD